MATNQKQSSSKSLGNPCQSSFTFRGTNYVVEMIDPEIKQTTSGGIAIPYRDGGRYSGGRWVKTKKGSQRVDMDWTPPTWDMFHEIPDAKNRNKILNGFYCPATFRVTGFNYDVTLTTGAEIIKAAKGSRNSRIIIQSLTVKRQAGLGSEPVTRPRLGRLPVATLLDHAIRASQFTAQYTDDISPRQNLEIIKLGTGGLLTTIELDQFAGRKRRGNAKADDVSTSRKNLERVAKLWDACPANYPGGRDAYIRKNMVYPNGEPMYEISQRNRQINHARKLKLIPPVPKKYNYKRNKTKRESK